MPAGWRMVSTINVCTCTACVGLLAQRACIVWWAQLERAARRIVDRALNRTFIAGVSKACGELRMRAVIVLWDGDVALTAIFERLRDELRLVMHHEVLLFAIDFRLRLLLVCYQVYELYRFRVVLLQVGARLHIDAVLAILIASYSVRSTLAKRVHRDHIIPVPWMALILQLGGDGIRAGQLRHFIRLVALIVFILRCTWLALGRESSLQDRICLIILFFTDR